MTRAFFAVKSGARIPHPPPPTSWSVFLAMHMDGSYADLAGNVFVDGAISTDNPRFGSACAVANDQLPALSTSRGSFNLGFEFSLDFWVYTSSVGANQYFFRLGSNNPLGGPGGPGGDERQFLALIDCNTGAPLLNVAFPNGLVGSGAGLGLNASFPLDLNAWYFGSVQQDATGNRLYQGKQGDAVAVLVDENLASDPEGNGHVWYQSLFTNQCFLLTTAYAGGGSPWPEANVYTSPLIGKLDDVYGKQGPGAATRFGSTTPMPTAPFQTSVLTRYSTWPSVIPP